MTKKARLAIPIACLACSVMCIEQRPAYSNEQPLMQERIYMNNKPYEDSINIDTQLRDLFGLNLYPEERMLRDSLEASKEHERLRKKMLTQ